MRSGERCGLRIDDGHAQGERGVARYALLLADEPAGLDLERQARFGVVLGDGQRHRQDEFAVIDVRDEARDDIALGDRPVDLGDLNAFGQREHREGRFARVAGVFPVDVPVGLHPEPKADRVPGSPDQRRLLRDEFDLDMRVLLERGVVREGRRRHEEGAQQGKGKKRAAPSGAERAMEGRQARRRRGSGQEDAGRSLVHGWTGASPTPSHSLTTRAPPGFPASWRRIWAWPRPSPAVAPRRETWEDCRRLLRLGEASESQRRSPRYWVRTNGGRHAGCGSKRTAASRWPAGCRLPDSRSAPLPRRRGAGSCRG